MTTTVSGLYRSDTHLRNVLDDLLATGITDEKVRVDHDAHRVTVLMPDVTARTALEILHRHELHGVELGEAEPRVGRPERRPSESSGLQANLRGTATPRRAGLTSPPSSRAGSTRR